jgi:hypothetical protein
VLELDLIGRPVTLSESDARWIYRQAKATSGHSLGARDLVTRLQALDAAQERTHLVLTRPEASALARVLAEPDEAPPGCDELRALLVELLSTNRTPPTPPDEGDDNR